MPADVEDRLRETFAALRDEPADAVGRRLSDAALPHLGGRRVRRTLRRWLAPALATAAVAAVAIVFLVALTASPDPAPERPATPAPAGPGIELTLRVTPRDGTPAAQVAERLARTMQARAVAARVEDTRVSAQGDLVTVFTPRTTEPDFATGLYAGLDFAVHDVGDPVLTAPSDAAMADLLARRRVEGPRRFYLEVTSRSPGTGFLVGPYATMAAAVREARRKARRDLLPGERIQPIAVSADLLLVRVGRRTLMIRDSPVVGAGDVEALRAEGDDLAIVVRPSARERVENALARAAITPGSRLQVETTMGISGTSSRPRVDPGTGTLRLRLLPAAARLIAARLPLGGVGADIAVVGQTVTGRVPPRPGERVDRLPPPLERFVASALTPSSLRPVRSTVRLVVRARWRGREWTLWSMRTRDGSELTSRVPPDADAGAGTGGCPFVPVTSILVCGGSGAPGAWITTGRVGPAVARVEAVYPDGSRVPGEVANGFFMLFLPTAKGEATRLSVIDRVGAEIASVPPRVGG